MDHNYYKELLQRSVYEELNKSEEEILENHLCECTECTEELEKIKKLYVVFNSGKPDLPEDNVLVSARNELFGKIAEEESKTGFAEKVKIRLHNIWFRDYRIVFSGAFALIVGFVFGAILFYNSSTTVPVVTEGTDVDNPSGNSGEISNIRFKNPFTDDGEIEISYDIIKPITYKGSMDDERVQALLAKALVSSNNPGFKIKTINTMAFRNDKKFPADEKVKTALITTVKEDENPGVRREALNLLAKYPYDETIRDVLIDAMKKDKNSGIRVAAINLLADLTPEGISIDDELKSVLKSQAEQDGNDYIKLRAASLIKEIN